MEFYCEKYRETLVGPKIVCRHPKEYCKFRSACLAHFMGKDEGDSERPEERTDSGCHNDSRRVSPEK